MKSVLDGQFGVLMTCWREKLRWSWMNETVPSGGVVAGYQTSMPVRKAPRLDPWTVAMVLHTMNVRVAYDHLLRSADDKDVDKLVEAVTHVWARTVGLEHVKPGPPTPGYQGGPPTDAD